MINSDQIRTKTTATKSVNMPVDNTCVCSTIKQAEGTDASHTISVEINQSADGIFIEDHSVKNDDMDDLQETLKTLSIGRSSPLRMRSVSPSPPNNFSLSPGPARRRANTFTAGQLHRSQIIIEKGMSSWFSPPHSQRRLPRDPIQPSTGSISDLSDRHSSAGEGDDEDEGDDDQFSLQYSRQFRPRSRTCPENRAWRKKKLKVLNRPPTPPPCSSPTLAMLTSSLDVPSSPSKSPLGGSVERLSRRSSRDSRELPSFEEEDLS